MATATKNRKASGGSGGGAGGLLAELQSMPPLNPNSRGCWEDSLPPPTRAELDAIKSAIRAGTIKHSKRAVYRFLREKGIINVAVGAFRNYLERP